MLVLIYIICGFFRCGMCIYLREIFYSVCILRWLMLSLIMVLSILVFLRGLFVFFLWIDVFLFLFRFFVNVWVVCFMVLLVWVKQNLLRFLVFSLVGLFWCFVVMICLIFRLWVVFFLVFVRLVFGVVLMSLIVWRRGFCLLFFSRFRIFSLV